MDIDYILINSLIYGFIGLLIGSYFAYKRYVNLWVGGMFILASYIIYIYLKEWFTGELFGFWLLFLFIYFILDYFLHNAFVNDKKRRLFTIIFTLGVFIFIENIIWYFRSSSVIGLIEYEVSLSTIWAIFVILNIILIYLLRYTFTGKVFTAIQENYGTVKSLWVNIDKFLFPYFLFLWVGLCVVAYINLTGNVIRPADSFFYVIKWFGVVILAGLLNLEFIFIATMLYIMFEYTLFLTLWFPIAYKDSTILFVILLVLLLKPEGIFTFKSRKL